MSTPSNFLSITGQPLELRPESKYQGWYYVHSKAALEPQMNALVEH